MPTRTRVLSATLGVALVAALGAASVLAPGAAGAAVRPSRAAQSAPPTPPTADFTVVATLSAGSRTFSVTASGQVDYATAQLSATVTLPETVGQLAAALPAKLQALVPAAVKDDSTVSVVASKGTVYVSLPGFAVGTMTWVSLGAPARFDAAIAAGYAKAGQLLGDAHALEAMGAGLHTPFKSLGTTTIDGSSATGVSTDIEVSKVLAKFPKAPARLRTAVEHALGTAIPLELWANASGALVQGSVSVSHPATSANEPARAVHVAVTLSGLGSPSTITVPPAADTLAVPASLFAGFAGHHAFSGPSHPTTTS